MAKIYFFTRKQLEDRLSARRVARIYDDNNDGSADADPILQLRADATSKVMGYVGPLGMVPALEELVDANTGELMPGKEFPHELTRIALDVAEALAARRFPEIMRMNWEVMMKDVNNDLKMLREGAKDLGASTAPGPKNEGAHVIQNTSVVPAVDFRRFWDDMGDF